MNKNIECEYLSEESIDSDESEITDDEISEEEYIYEHTQDEDEDQICADAFTEWFNDIDKLYKIEDMTEDGLMELLDQISCEEVVNERLAKKFCEECKTGTKLFEDYTSGYVVCTGCGQIFETLFDQSPEWRLYDEDGTTSKGRCSFMTSMCLPQMSLGTQMGFYGNSKLRAFHLWNSIPYKERSLYAVFRDIQNKCRKAGILKCAEDDAKILYKNISECKYLNGDNEGKSIIIRGKNRKGLIAACVFYACKRIGKTRSPKEIAALFGIKSPDVTRGCKTFLRLMKIRKMAYDYVKSQPGHFIPRFCKVLELKQEYVDKTIIIAKNIQRLNIASVNTSLAVATGSLLLMSEMNNLTLTRKTLAKQFKVSELTITKAYKKIVPYKEILTNDILADKVVELIQEQEKNNQLPENLKNKYEAFKAKYDINTSQEVEIETEESDDITNTNDINIHTDLEEYINEINLKLYDKIQTTNMIFQELVLNYISA